jgi:hypothetical protein
MTSLLRIAAVGATLFGLSTEAFAGGPSTTIVNNGNNNINIVVNVQGPTINLPPLPGLPSMPYPPTVCPPGFPFGGPQNTIVNIGNGNVNQIENRGRFGGARNEITNFGDFNRNYIANHGHHH